MLKAPRKQLRVTDPGKHIAKDLFERFDMDKNGAIDKDELKAAIEDILKKRNVAKVNVTDESVGKWLEFADTNKDKQISMEEVESFVRDHLSDTFESEESPNVVELGLLCDATGSMDKWIKRAK